MTPLTRRAALAAPLLLAAPALLRAGAARGQSAWPDRPIRIVVAFPAGTITDTLVRHLAEPLGRELGRPVIVDNRPGGNGVVGTEAAARSAPDGHTWCVLSPTNGALNTYLVRRLPYDPLRDFTPIGFVADSAYVLVVPAAHPARDLAGLLELARRSPGTLNFSHGNSTAHIAGATMARLAGVELTAVPYRGGPEALTDVIAGRIDCTFTDFNAGLPQIRDGKLRALGVTLPQAFALAPDIPPVAALLPGFDLPVWFGLAAPAGTPGPVIGRANAALNTALALPEFAERLARLGFVPRGSTPEFFGTFLRQQIESLTARAKEVGLEPG